MLWMSTLRNCFVADGDEPVEPLTHNQRVPGSSPGAHQIYKYFNSLFAGIPRESRPGRRWVTFGSPTDLRLHVREPEIIWAAELGTQLDLAANGVTLELSLRL